MLGLEAPAFAATTITSFSPLSGPVGCVVVITGTEFQTPDVVDVEFNNTDASSFTLVSDTEIWATVPTGATSGPIDVTNSAAVTATSPSSFTVTSGTGIAGGCAPTVSSFAPTCGAAGTVVKITGTNLLRDDGTIGAAGIVGGVVKFAPYAAAATHTGTSETTTELSVLVPSTAADGPIRVNTWNDVIGEGAVLSTTSFAVPPPTCPVEGGNVHARSISLSLRKHLVARGKVSSTEDPAFTDCVAAVPVKIQRRVSGHWKTVGSTTTTDTGSYKKRIRDRAGKYRAKAPKVTLGDPVTDTCSPATSPVRRHTH
jgi:hypothetical protein